MHIRKEEVELSFFYKWHDFLCRKNKQSASETDRVYKPARHKIDIQKSTIFVYTSYEQLKIKIKNKNTINYSIKCEMPRDKYDKM